MGAVAVWIATLVGNILAAVGIFVTKKTALATAAIATCVALTLAMAAAIKVAILSITLFLPVWAQQGACMLPSNLALCMGLIVSAKMGRFVYDWNMANLKLASYIT